MFSRQWFAPGSQIGLNAIALELEGYLRGKLYGKAESLINKRAGTSSASEEAAYWNHQYLRLKKLSERNTNIIKVGFTSFWQGFNRHDNEIVNLLKHCASIVGFEIEIVEKYSDIVVCSCFGDPELREFTGATRILYLGENIRPNYRAFDYSMTFDLDSYSGRNLYLPLWVLRSRDFAPKNANYRAYDLKNFCKRTMRNNGKEEIVVIANNHTPGRLEAINILRKHGYRVMCHGSQTKPVENKHATLKEYKYSLCFENSYYPGYVTEKIFDCIAAGCTPIYWGGIGGNIYNSQVDFICETFLPLEESLADIVYRMKSLEPFMQPILEEQKLEKVYSSMVKWIASLFYELF